MSRIERTFVLALGSVWLAGPTAWAGSNTDGTIYRMNNNATYQEGCFDPCDCPLGEPQPVVGAFVLGPAVIGDVVDFHEVREINWRVGHDNTRFRITGSGVYRITNYGPPLMHALDLDLSIDGGAPQHFFSDFVPVTSNDGTIDIPVSMNGVFCYDIVIRVSASPARPQEIIRYGLGPGSTFQRGCFDPCDCPLEAPRLMFGRFALVKVVDFGTFREYALVGARFAVRSSANVDQPIKLTGFGWYTHIDGVAGPIHSLEMTMSLNGKPPQEFDSGLLNTEPTFPAFFIVVDMNDQVCFDIVLTLNAKPLWMNAVSAGG